MEYSGKDTPWPNSHDADSEGSEPVSGEESGFMMAASDTTSSVSPVQGLVIADSPAGSIIPSSDMVTQSGSKARAVVGDSRHGLESIGDQVSVDIGYKIQASKSNLMARGVAIDLL